MKHITLLAAAGALALPASAQMIVETVTFDCSGEMARTLQTDAGPRATGLVEITIDLPNGAEWRSSGVMVIDLPATAAEADLSGRKIGRCVGEAQMIAEPASTISGVQLYTIRLDPSRVNVRVGNRRFTDPAEVGFSSQAGGSPNV